MIEVRRVDGSSLFLNEDLIETIEATPETVVTLVDGRRLMLADSPNQIVELCRRFRATVLVATEEMGRARAGH